METEGGNECIEEQVMQKLGAMKATRKLNVLLKDEL